ncbi:MAG: helix-turn-helix domain-containing protein, partial [Actinomycetota bacterium]
MGRPREFDSDAVLSNIVDLFWERGFSATSLSDIIECTGLSRSSLYGAFGSKDELLRAALDRYLSDHERMVTEHLVDGEAGLDDIDRFLAQIDQQAISGQQRGCLAVNTATEIRSPEPALREVTNRHRATLRHGFTTALERAAALGEVDQHRVGDLANNLVTTAIGLAEMATEIN